MEDSDEEEEEEENEARIDSRPKRSSTIAKSEEIIVVSKLIPLAQL